MALEPWMVEVNAAGVAKVAEALELRIEGRIPCTSCGGAVQSDFSAWACPRCATRGNALVYAALALGAGRASAASSWCAVRAALAARGLCRPAA